MHVNMKLLTRREKIHYPRPAKELICRVVPLGCFSLSLSASFSIFDMETSCSFSARSTSPLDSPTWLLAGPLCSPASCQLIRQLLFFPDRLHVQIIYHSQLRRRNLAKASPSQALNDLTVLELHL
ncbi:hypothetical protein F3Y22_tig00110988pilonHSYRG00175 [Hibiscus syriacus]|uniref:Uncharacterized protein n=1 Tax=Hibiscus syriacus TaxID=106335 RepID=A0A6A2Z8Q3_HIBSY|nr:hypothetical protein F3Y22_tig00110988pilonHSYRG00175 [Hibiscus syriacus]